MAATKKTTKKVGKITYSEPKSYFTKEQMALLNAPAKKSSSKKTDSKKK